MQALRSSKRGRSGPRVHVRAPFRQYASDDAPARLPLYGRRYGRSGEHGLVLVAAVVAPSEAGEAALGGTGTELTADAGDRALDVAGHGIDPG